MSEEKEIIRFLLEQKVAFINTTLGICMLWWVSSVVFSGSALAGIWLRFYRLIDNKSVVHWLGVILSVFFGSMVSFGIMIVMGLNNLGKEIDELAQRITPISNFYATELFYFKWGMILGTSSFVLVWIAWCVMWLRLELGPSRQIAELSKPIETLNPTHQAQPAKQLPKKKQSGR